MRKLNLRFAVGAALVFGLVPASTSALAWQSGSERQANRSAGKVSKEEQTALAQIDAAVKAKDYATAATALAAAQPKITSPAARFEFARMQAIVGQATNNYPLVIAGTEALIASGLLPAANLGGIYRTLADAYEKSGQADKAAAVMAKSIEANPNDTDAMISAAQAHIKAKQPTQALPLLERAIAAQTAAGQKPPENWYRVAAGQALAANLTPQVMKLNRDMLAAYPTARNWRDTLLIMKELTPAADRDLELDIYRLIHANKALASERDYADFLRTLSNAGYSGEAKSVLDAGVAAGTISAAKAPFSDMRSSLAARAASGKAGIAAEEARAKAAPTGAPALLVANSYYGFGDFAKAAELYRVALQKGSVDANVVNTRLGLALGQAGQKAEAEAALKAVTGARGELAAFALLWLGQRA